MPTALIIDDDPELLLEISAAVREAGFTADTARDLDSARSRLLRSLPELALINVRIGGGDHTHDAFRIFARNDLTDTIEVYLFSREKDYETAVRGMQVGAADHFIWPEDAARLNERLVALRDRIASGGDGESPVHSSGRGLLQGESSAINRVYRMMRKVGPTTATVFLTGESGSGKELIARSIHELSDRVDGPFIAMNCGAIAAELIESELFGHRKGAFTGAHNSHTGFFERARGGTLFLDEVTEMSQDLQVKLLRVLETRMIRPVGGEKDIATDVRIIASTNRDPQEAVSEGVLREDLYYRLAEFPLRVPPLRERGEDIVLLAHEFLREANEREDATTEFSDEALDLLRLHDWPGNVRELKNAVSRAFILAADRILPDDLPGNIPAGGAMSGDYLRFPVGYNLKELERRMILATLEHFEGDKPRTAEALGISLKTLYNRLKQYRRHE
ncbi:MAG: sigma-54 dependent transcriptional regulator [Xanthomonadales bacterium]